MSAYNRKAYRAGMVGFGVSGFCAISAGVIVSLLRDRYSFTYSLTGTLVSRMNIGSMIATLIAGILPARIGERATALTLVSGTAAGYLIMALTGNPALLLLAFLLAGIAKGCAANKCTVLVGSNTGDRPRAMNLMNACYALGALACPFLISFLRRFGEQAPMLGVACAGVALWLVFWAAGLPGKPVASAKAREGYAFLKSGAFWLLTLLLFCQNGAEYTVNGWVVTYYKNEQILSGALAAYVVTVQWLFTLIARLLIAFFLRDRNPYKALTVMGLCLTVLYALLIRLNSALPAVAALGLFSFAMAGVYPMAVALVGRMLSSASVGVLLSLAGTGGIVFPWLVGVVADAAGLRAGMAVNLLPCAGIFILSFILLRRAAGANR